MIDLDEQKRILRLREGDYAAFEELYQQYGPTVYGNMLKVTKSRDDAEDLLQEVFLRLWQHRSEVKPDQSLKPYLTTIAYNLFKNAIQKHKIRAQVEAFLEYVQSELYEAVEEQVNVNELDELLRLAIDKLPPQRKKVFHLCRIEGLSYEQAAVMLGISTGTIRDHVVKANKFLKKELISRDSALIFAVFAHFIFES